MVVVQEKRLKKIHVEVSVVFRNIKEEIIANLKKATSDVRLAVAWLTDEDIIRVLTHLADSGVTIHIIICNSKENFVNTSKFRDLLRCKGRLYVATNPFMHHKFCIIDNNVIINGSYNWSYAARKQEENILILQLDGTMGDAALLKKFETKFNYLYDRCSVAIKNIAELDAFKHNPVEMSMILSGMDVEEIQLRLKFEVEVQRSIDTSRKLRIPFDYTKLLDRMQLDGGGVNMVKRLLHDEITTNEMKSGFRKLEEQIPHRVDLSLEFLVSRPVYSSLFSIEEVEFCKKLMQKYNL